MGFSLQAFINQLYRIMALDTDEQDILSRLEETIKDGSAYALECGQIETIPETK